MVAHSRCVERQGDFCERAVLTLIGQKKKEKRESQSSELSIKSESGDRLVC